MALQSSLRKMNTKVTLIATLVLCCLIGASQARHHRFHGRRMTKSRLFNELCNDSQDDNTIGRDACYGCFYRTKLVARGFPKLAAISSCADKYISNPAYDHCKAYLRNATTAVEDRGTPRTVYCTVLECVSQVNKNTLESLVNVSPRPDAELVTKEEKVLSEKKRSAMAINRYLVGAKRFCDVDSHVERYNRHRSGEVQQYHQRRHFRRNLHQESIGNSPRNIFQFYIDGAEPRHAFQHYRRIHFNENQMHGYGPEYNRLYARQQRYHL